MQDVRIKRLRLHANGGNRVAARLALQQTLRQTPLQPSFLPSGAVLVIRRLDHLSPLRGPAAHHNSGHAGCNSGSTNWPVVRFGLQASM